MPEWKNGIGTIISEWLFIGKKGILGLLCQLRIDWDHSGENGERKCD